MGAPPRKPEVITLLEPVPDGRVGPGRWEVTIPAWRPTSLNELMKVHFAAAARLKRLDCDTVTLFAALAHIPHATGKRRVSLRITLEKGQRRWDCDALWKSLLDACVHAKLLVDDHPDHCVLGTVEYTRGADMATTLVIEDAFDVQV